jgi:hypothetical protein
MSQQPDIFRRLIAILALGWYLGQIEVRGATPPQLTRVAPSSFGIQLDWTSSDSGLDYTVQSRDALGGEGLWLIPPGDQPWPITSIQWTDARPVIERTRFYRVLAVPTSERGKLLSVSEPASFTRATIGLLAAAAGIPITPQYDVSSYTVVYETIDPDGGRTFASGSVLLPIGVSNALALASYQHATIPRTNDAPGTELLAGVAFATTGYAAVVPNFLGLGDPSTGLQPYYHAHSEATACVDLLRAARSLCATNGQLLNGQLFLAGYSQGGHVTLALLRELEMFHTNEFSVTACAPMAGAYDLSGVTTDDFLSGRIQANPYYFALLLAAYQSVYHLAPTLADLFAPPYDTTLPPLLQGNATGDEINAAMPGIPTQILNPQYLAAFRANTNHPFRLALRDNDLYRWRPRAPLHLYHCQGDHDVLFANSQVTLDSFQSLGATQAQLIDPMPAADHADCALPSLFDAKAWFDSLRQ